MESARRPPGASAKGQPRRARESDRLQRRPPVPRAAARQDAHRQLLEFRLCRAIWSSRGEARLSRVEGVAVADGFRPSAGASGSTLTPVPLPAHRTQRAVFPHWALGRDHAFAHGKPPRPHSQAFPSVAPPQPTIREAHDLPRLHPVLPAQPPVRPPARPPPMPLSPAPRGRPKLPIPCACNARWSFRTVPGTCRLAPVSRIPVPFPTSPALGTLASRSGIPGSGP